VLTNRMFFKNRLASANLYLYSFAHAQFKFISKTPMRDASHYLACRYEVAFEITVKRAFRISKTAAKSAVFLF